MALKKLRNQLVLVFVILNTI